MTSPINGRSRVYGIIGDPVEHSVSPVMHNAALGHLGIDAAYVPFRVGREALPGAVCGLRDLNIAGVNVTIPHKVAVLPLLDELDPLAAKIGAVNTIVNCGGRLKGYNTDAPGFLRPLLERGVAPEGKDVVIIGAGGAARAIAFSLAERGARLTILNRGRERARELAVAIRSDIHTLELNEANLAAALGRADILVNATSLGMTPDIAGTPAPARLLRKGLVVYDAVYNPLQTRLLKEADAAGAVTISGIDMLVWQGALALEKWTGRPAPVELMKQAAVRFLGL
ncbi:MAG: shikimate dehydrogenase [Chloroflexi bacterium]|nr:shikimate dehydrogenase [Chloroflexota bacterium]